MIALPTSFNGRISQGPYALWVLGVLFSQHVIVAAAYWFEAEPLDLDWEFVVAPLRSLVILEPPDGVLVLGLLYLLLAAWMLAALSFRRATDAGVAGSLSVIAIVPVLQLAAIGILASTPSRPDPGIPPYDDFPAASWASAAQGVVAGIVLTILAVVVSALIFGSYGYGMFVAAPFVIGATTAFIANRKGDVGGWTTTLTVCLAMLLGGAGLIAAALEGLMCIVAAFPLALGAAVVGGLLGRRLALLGHRPATGSLPAIAVLPVIFALEAAFPSLLTFETTTAISIAAPPSAVWESVVEMDEIDGHPALPFRLGVAYALGAEIIGAGVGAKRLGRFSSGTAVERVTEWVPGQLLTFVVETDVPAMKELSPYDHVHAPHAVGYFRTVTTSFQLVPMANGYTELSVRSGHMLRLDPALYWLPMVRLIVGENSDRVLAHIKREAENRLKLAAAPGLR